MNTNMNSWEMSRTDGFNATETKEWDKMAYKSKIRGTDIGRVNVQQCYLCIIW